MTSCLQESTDSAVQRPVASAVFVTVHIVGQNLKRRQRRQGHQQPASDYLQVEGDDRYKTSAGGHSGQALLPQVD